MSKESSQLELALTDCRQQKEPNFKATAARYPGVNRTTLSRRSRGVQRSYIESPSESIQNLTIAQEALPKKRCSLTSLIALPTVLYLQLVKL